MKKYNLAVHLDKLSSSRFFLFFSTLAASDDQVLEHKDPYLSSWTQRSRACCGISARRCCHIFGERKQAQASRPASSSTQRTTGWARPSLTWGTWGTWGTWRRCTLRAPPTHGSSSTTPPATAAPPPHLSNLLEAKEKVGVASELDLLVLKLGGVNTDRAYLWIAQTGLLPKSHPAVSATTRGVQLTQTTTFPGAWSLRSWPCPRWWPCTAQSIRRVMARRIAHRYRAYMCKPQCEIFNQDNR